MNITKTLRLIAFQITAIQMPAQFVLLLWGVALCRSPYTLEPKQRRVLAGLLAIGVITTVCDLALLLGYAEGDKLHFAGKVGTGFSSKQRVELKKQLVVDAVKGPAAVGAPRLRDAIWVDTSGSRSFPSARTSRSIAAPANGRAPRSTCRSRRS